MNTLSTAASLEWLEAGMRIAREHKLPPMALTVLDVRGALVPTGPRFDTADLDRLSAEGILSGAFITSLAVASGGEFNPNPGGALLYLKGELAGAIGASGASATADQ